MSSARLAFVVLATLLFATPGLSERAWIKDELRLNLRTGADVKFRIIGRMKTGDAVEILERADGWTRIQVAELGEGWIPEGYLQPTPPASLRLDQSESQTEELRARVESLTTRITELEGENATLLSRDADRENAVSTLTQQNMALNAGARWPHWLTGAGLLAAGMLIGIVVRAVGARRSRPRLRL